MHEGSNFSSATVGAYRATGAGKGLSRFVMSSLIGCRARTSFVPLLDLDMFAENGMAEVRTPHALRDGDWGTLRSVGAGGATSSTSSSAVCKTGQRGIRKARWLH